MASIAANKLFLISSNIMSPSVRLKFLNLSVLGLGTAPRFLVETPPFALVSSFLSMAFTSRDLSLTDIETGAANVSCSPGADIAVSGTDLSP